MKTPRKKPIHFSQKLFDEMMEELMLGYPLSQICSGDKRPTLRSFYRWLYKNPALLSPYRHARDISADSLEGNILTLINTTTTTNVSLCKLRFEMLRWIMARRAPKRYGEKQTIEHTGHEGGPLTEIRRIIIDPSTKTSPSPDT